MAQANIVFENLRAEMARKEIRIRHIAWTLDVNRDTAARKLSGKVPITLSEAFRIQRIYFPDLTLQYLFQELVTPTEG